MNKWVSHMQRGFLHGRSMLSNIVDVDFESMKISLKHQRGAIILFDFAAAFPSVSQEYMWNVLTHIGLQPGLLRAIQSLYCNNMHFVKIKSYVFCSFSATSGVRQGCPLSPLLFAVVADVLLRRLDSHLQGTLVRAFADDTAVVTPDFEKHASTIMTIFREFAEVSNLHLNIQKTVLIQLWQSSAQTVRRRLAEKHPNWKDVEIAWQARYLGFSVGPERGHESWKKASQKFQSRVVSWASLHLGMYMNAQIYRSLCMSVLSFLGQLEEIPDEVMKLEPWALRQLAPGPGNWIRTTDLFHLRKYGHPFAFQSFQLTALAAKLRVYHFEPQLQCKELHSKLVQAFASAQIKHAEWDQWYNLTGFKARSL